MEISEELGEQIQDDDKFEEESFQEEVKYKQLINELKQKVILTKTSSENRKQHLIRNLRRLHCQKIQIKKIAGDYTEWQSFEQSFDEAVHKNKKKQIHFKC